MQVRGISQFTIPYTTEVKLLAYNYGLIYTVVLYHTALFFGESKKKEFSSFVYS